MLRPEAAAHPLAAVLRGVEKDSCPGRLNFHCHTTCSDGSLSPADLASRAMAMELEHLAVTDHHSDAACDVVEAIFSAARASGGRPPILWRAVEISALLEGCLVHVLALGIQAGAPSLKPYLQGQACVGPSLRSEAVVAAIRAAGGLAMLAHPGRYRLPHPSLIQAAATAGFDGAEAWYDYGLEGPWQPTPLICDAIAADLQARGLLLSCGTDTHGLELHCR